MIFSRSSQQESEAVYFPRILNYCFKTVHGAKEENVLMNITKIYSKRVHLLYKTTVTIPPFLSEKIHISAKSMKIASIKVSSVTAQPETHSHFMSGVRP